MVSWCEHSVLMIAGLVADFFVTRQMKQCFATRNAKENVHKGLPSLVNPCCLRALHAKNAIAFFAKHARLSQSADFAFAASKRTAKTEGFLREEMPSLVGEGLAPPDPTVN